MANAGEVKSTLAAMELRQGWGTLIVSTHRKKWGICMNCRCPILFAFENRFESQPARVGFVSSPRPSIFTVTDSLGLSQRFGVRPRPTPAGVPVETMSPGSSGVMEEM